jgi:hypothetical protein
MVLRADLFGKFDSGRLISLERVYNPLRRYTLYYGSPADITLNACKRQ